MTLPKKLMDELRALTLAMLYFGVWIGALLLLKHLVLAEYAIEFRHYSLALVGALILSKVVLILEHVPLGAWVRARPAWVDVILRTALYSSGVAVVLVLEKGFEGRHEYGGFGPAVRGLFQATDTPHVLVNTLCLSGALLGYNVLAVVRHHVGPGGLLRCFTSPLPDSVKPARDSRRKH